MSKVSIKGAAAAARREDTRVRKQVQDSAKGSPALSAATVDSFVNFAHKMGVGADNALSSASYGFNPITRNRTLLEWVHRGSWIGGLIVDTVADDMTRAGIDYVTEIPPEQTEMLDHVMTGLATWSSIGDVIRWGRLYGGAIGVALIDGQDMREPLRLDTVGRGQYRGMLVLDRWMVEPTLDDLVTEFGPDLGLPRYYRVGANAPALRNRAIHYSRVMIRHDGVTLPYQQRMMENLWGISVIERLYDRMTAFDSATTGAAQLVYKAYLRTMKIKDMRTLVASGGPALQGLVSYMDMTRRFQNIEGITMIDAEDEFEAQAHSAFSGLSDILNSFGQQLAGGAGIPLTRLFGQSPAGMNATGESDMRMYYDSINQQQERTIMRGVTMMYKLGARSCGIELPADFALSPKSLWELSDGDKANIAKTGTDTVIAAHDSGLISPQLALKEMRQASRTTGLFTNITKQMIDDADDQVQPPSPEGMGNPLLGLPGSGGDNDTPTDIAPGQLPTKEGMSNGTPGQNGTTAAVDQGPRSRNTIQLPPPQRRPARGGPGAGPVAGN